LKVKVERGITVKKSEDFSEWYTQVITKADLCDYAGIKGFIVFKPYSYEIWENIRKFLDGRLKATGHKNAYFPTLIPESYLKKEAEHFSGFVPEVFWVTRTGENELGEPLAMRPTSETIVCDSYSKWVKSWRDLPILINLWNSVFRAEIKATKPFLRTSEFLWQEGHTAHATAEEAEKEVHDILEIYRQLVEEQLAVPVLLGSKTEAEKFVGAIYTLTMEAMIPDGKALQMGTSHFLGQNFSQPFEIKYLGKDEKDHYVWQTSWGVSTRMIGAAIMLHSDDKGLVLPPRVAPIQAVVVPIYYKDEDRDKVLSKAKEIVNLLTEKGVSIHLDDRIEYTPGWKFNEWEMKGVPTRIEIGPRDIAAAQVIVSRRDTGGKSVVKMANLSQEMVKILESLQADLYERAKRQLEENIRTVRSYDEFKKTLETKGGFVRACWCGKSECESKIKEDTGATIRTVPLQKEEPFGDCVLCGEKAKDVVYFARAY
jgi:prolyl-tRNA synthetase